MLRPVRGRYKIWHKSLLYLLKNRDNCHWNECSPDINSNNHWKISIVCRDPHLRIHNNKLFYLKSGAVVAVIVWLLVLHIELPICHISTYHHWCCEFESQSGRGVQHYMIKFVSDLRQVNGFLQVLRFPPPIKLTIKPTNYLFEIKFNFKFLFSSIYHQHI